MTIEFLPKICDSSFCIGMTHRVCQDYARHNNSIQSVILSDGCSSSPDTDIGARILVSVLEKHLINNLRISTNADCLVSTVCNITKPVFHDIIAQSKQILTTLDNFSLEALDSTLLIAYVCGDHFNVAVWGDGCVVTRNRENKELNITQIEFPDGYPYYPSYICDTQRHEAYLKSGHGKVAVKLYTYDANNQMIDFVEDEVKIRPLHLFSFDINRYDLVAIMSDGIRDFNKISTTESSKINTKIDENEMICRLFDFKSFGGAFVQRRLNKFIKDINKENIYNFDDFSIGAIYAE